MRSFQRFRIFISPSPFLPSSSKHTLSLSSLNRHSSSSSSADVKTESIDTTLTEQQLTQINLLIPRLCSSNYLHEAIRLIDAALITNPPLNSISISILISRLTVEPDLTQSMSFLNRLKHNPNSHPNLLSITKMIISSYFKTRNPRGGIKVFQWLSRPDSPCRPDLDLFAIVFDGLCEHGMIFEGLKVVRAMVNAGLVPAPEVRTRVYMSLLSEARVKEAKEVFEGLNCVESGGESAQHVMRLLDDMISGGIE